MNSPNKKQTDTLFERYLRLMDITRDLSSTLNLDTVLDKIVGAAADLTDSNDASILLYDEKHNLLYFHTSTNLDTVEMKGLLVPVEGSIAGTIVTTREPLKVMKVEDDPRHYDEIGESVRYDIESLLGVPMITKDKVVGVLETINKREGEFTQDDEDLLSALGSQAAVAIENTRLFNQSDLIAEMVHELRTPLASINTASNLLMRSEISQEQRASMAETIQRESNRLSEMATSFLDLARLESGRTTYNMKRVDLKKLLEEGVEIMDSRIKEQNLTLEWAIEKKTSAFRGDADKLKQVILNLLSNAIKYNQTNGKITIGLSSNKKEISFYVSDTGRGILPEHRESLFEKFYRVPGSEKIAEGTGLGLSITKKIIEDHGGTIIVESELRKGTIFTVILPRSQ